MKRSPDSELAERINMAIVLLKTSSSQGKVVSTLMEQFGISRRQAYRYIQEAQKTKRQLPIPEQKMVFTVKLPMSIVFRVRQFSKLTGESLSTIVTQALKAFLKRQEHG